NIEHGVLFTYNGSTAIYHCPADKSTVAGHKGLPRFRSYSLNWYLGVDPSVWYSEKIRARYSEIGNPSQVYAFIDEDDLSIDDGTFWCPIEIKPLWGDVPADRHSLGCNLSFADGHVDRWPWRWPKHGHALAVKPLNASDQRDLERLWSATP